MASDPVSSTTVNIGNSSNTLFKTWRERFVMPLLIGVLVFGAIALIFAVGNAANNFIRAIFITTYVATGLVTAIRFSYNIRISVFLIGIYTLGLSELASQGILGDSLFFFLGVIIFSAMMLSPKAGIAALILDIVTFIFFGWLMQSGIMSPALSNTSPATIQDWLSASAVLIMFGVAIILGFQRLELDYADAQRQIDATLNTLTDERNNLENRVADRTRKLRRVNEIGRSVSSTLDNEELLDRATRLIGDEFECYYTAIYLTDNSGNWAELKQATGEAGKVLRENKHRVEINGKNPLGIAIQARQVRIALDTGPDAVRFEIPLLPYTRSQIILPLLVGETIIGALEMHSTKESAFSGQDVDTYQNMANAIAIALENSRLFNEAQQSLFEMRATQRQYVLGAWASLSSEQPLDYEVGDEAAGDKPINVPLMLRDQVIGDIFMASANEWTPEQKNLINSIAIQASLALENARLVEESQSIAARESIANEIIAKVWSSSTLDGILQTTVRELGRALEAAEVDIELSMDNDHE